MEDLLAVTHNTLAVFFIKSKAIPLQAVRAAGV
jgi:hypothetical protein